VELPKSAGDAGTVTFGRFRVIPWRHTFVDESNLKVNVCPLRRSLDDTRKHPQYRLSSSQRRRR
jgi:hypothetical protein